MSELATEDRSADDTFDARGMLVMPGLINGHNHHWGSLVKNTGAGLYDRANVPWNKTT
jgi:cytosine/adenosine deaminase-related metal-dependent hydrolase